MDGFSSPDNRYRDSALLTTPPRHTLNNTELSLAHVCHDILSCHAFYRIKYADNIRIYQDMTAYQRVLLKLGTTHPTYQNTMDCQTHVWSGPMGEHVT